MAALQVRFVKEDDIGAIDFLLSRRREDLQNIFGLFHVPAIIELSQFALVAVDSNSRLVGFVAIDDAPSIPEHVTGQSVMDLRAWAALEGSDLGFPATTTMWVTLACVVAGESEEEESITSAIFRAFFSLAPNTTSLLILEPGRGMYFSGLFKAISTSPELAVTISSCTRSGIQPHMRVREARVEDHDDLLPVLEGSMRRQAPLTDIPDWAEPDKPFALARMIAAQNSCTRVLAAEAGSKVVGLMAFSADVDVQMLQQAFDLSPFSFLVREEERPESSEWGGTQEDARSSEKDSRGSSRSGYMSSASEASVLREGGESGGSGVGSRADTPLMMPPPNPAPLESESGTAARASDAGSASGAGGGGQLDGIQEQTEVEGSMEEGEQAAEGEAGAEAGEEEVAGLQIVEGPSNAFCVTMFCVEEEWESQLIDFLPTAFEQYPGREYCVLTLPHTVKELLILQHFVRVPQRVGSTSPLVLYILHHNGLLPGFEVRHASPRDIAGIRELASLALTQRHGSAGSAEPPSRQATPVEDATLVAAVDAQVVGVAIFSLSAPLPTLCSHFHLPSLVNVEQHSPDAHCVLRLLSMRPIFAHHRRLFLQQAMRILNRSIILCPVFPDESRPEVLADLMPVPPRQHACMASAIDWGTLGMDLDLMIDNAGGYAGQQLQSGSDAPPIAEGTEEGDTQGGSSEAHPSVDNGDNHPSLIRGPPGLKIPGMKGLGFCLYLTSRRLIYRRRAVINARIVVVGSSDTSTAFIHGLCICPALHFTGITLVSTNGHANAYAGKNGGLGLAPGPGTTPQKLALEFHAGMMEASMVGVDRESQCVILSNNTVLPYEYLVIAAGLQDQTHTKLPNCTWPLQGWVRSHELVRGSYMSGREEDRGDVRGISDSGHGGGHGRSSREHIVVYGFSLEALFVVQYLLASGMNGHEIVLINPEAESPDDAAIRCLGDNAIASKVVEEIRSAGIVCKQGMRLLEVIPDQSGKKVKAIILEKTPLLGGHGPGLDHRMSSSTVSNNSAGTLVGTHRHRSDRLQVLCRLLVTCEGKDVDKALFSALNDSSLVYDGRLVINGAFQTNDESIFGAGPLCKFSRRYGKQVPLEHYNSFEVGSTLAKSFTTILISQVMREFSKGCPLSIPHLQSNSEGHTSAQALPEALPHRPGPPPLPRLSQAKVIGGILPGGYSMVCAANPVWHAERGLPKASQDFSSGLRSIVTNRLAHPQSVYCRVDFSADERIQSILSFQKSPQPMWQLQQIVGLPITLFGNDISKGNLNEYEAISILAAKAWASAIYHEDFIRLLNALRETADVIPLLNGEYGLVQKNVLHKDDVQLSSTSSSPMEAASNDPAQRKHSLGSFNFVQERLLHFIKEKIDDFPCYTIPTI